jgi:hypothetical protein
VEAERQPGGDPRALLRELQGKVSARKLRLFSLACVRRFECFLAHPRLEKTRAAITVLERHIEGRASQTELQAAQAAALQEIERNVMEQALENWTGSDMGHVLLANDAETAAARHIDLTQDFAFDVVVDRLPESLTGDEAWEMVTGPVRAQLCRWLQDVAGEPSHPVRLHPEWRTPDAVAVASEMYARRDFVALPVLAELLRGAGCEDPSLIRHCREPGEHIRGCWVVDLVLGKG